MMKKSCLMMNCVLVTLMHAAEDQKSVSLTIKSTLFKITQGRIHEHSSEVDLIVLGRNQQQKLKAPTVNRSNRIGEISFSRDKNNTIMIFSNKKASETSVKCSILIITEPHMSLEDSYDKEKDCNVKVYVYLTTRTDPNDKNMFYDCHCRGNKAIFEASKDLQMCYSNALHEGLNVLQNKKDKKIAFDGLGTGTGFPRKEAAPLIFKAITDFINENRGYAEIQLFVKKRFELTLYKDLIEKL